MVDLSFQQEVHSEEIDTDSAYILFYEQQGVDYSQFLPKIDGKKMADTSSMDEDFESDYKKYCVLQWARRLPVTTLHLRPALALGRKRQLFGSSQTANGSEPRLCRPAWRQRSISNQSKPRLVTSTPPLLFQSINVV